MRAATDLYEHPALTSSEVWGSSDQTCSDKTRVFSVLGALSLAAAASSVAVYQYSGVVTKSIQGSHLLRNLL
ncbi:uncharacterized protein LACBIDRAFT_316390 [Laccaria bicolor S238N-H82]|uniref:Predicted protein n=1 Tax=Laccaria bicolor (strain S238N-H82 / ATCC MYA-4686) TaxID=486041 RepID=B0E0U8_LACBS|nr:uncharacterized protein LACBIDRAFT_316390 [Laccaria bicolor S238N-H82]EDQ99506.1 predicted protein [Laccaria bicolor S238N-H82]|eukprot:XP_001889855.1 predicted protein [Laccaria bicolor S238N-H82]